MRDHWREQPSSRMGLVRHAFRVCLTIGTLIALSACGGGGGGGGGDPSPGNPPPTDPPPANQVPTASAGDDQTIDLATGTVALAGSGDDADGDTLTYEWSSSPAENVSFDDASSPTATATFSAAGTYELTLTVNDGADSATDAVQIAVTEEPVAGQPVVQAGEDQTVEYPQGATLNGTATSDSDELTYAWTAEPADGVTFADAAAAATTVAFSAPGTYVLTLTASDAAASGSDSVQVVVDPAVYPVADLTEDDPQYGWTFVAPADIGMDETLLDQARDYALTAGGSGVIVRYGRVVKAWGDIDVRMAVQSTSKSIGGIALGLALEDGVVALEDFAATELPGFGVPPDANAATGWLDDITVLQLATHTAGFEKNRQAANDDPDTTDEDETAGSLLDEPGTVWRYSDGALNWLADVLTYAFNQDLEQVMVDRVWNVLGVRKGDDVQWRANESHAVLNANGVPQRELASGITINTQTMARVGLLFLREGHWAGTQVFEDTFDDLVRTPREENAALTIAEPADFPGATTEYGVLWWTNANGALAEVPQDAYWAWGQGDSLIVVIPSLDIVIARAGDILPNADDTQRAWGEGDWNGDYAVLAPFLDPIVQSVQE